MVAGVVCVGPTVRAQPGPPQRTQANVPVEITFTAQRPVLDPFNEVTLDVTFTPPSGPVLKVPAFWAGANRWKVRYASPLTGTHRWQTECSDAQDAGLHDVAGVVEVTPYTGDNPLFKHGPVRVAADRRHFEHADGTPFFWLGDTWWMGLCHRLHWPDEFRQLTADRKAKGFNVVQIVAGLYPDMSPFDPRGANEAGYPWKTNYTRLRPEYFDAADKRLRYLVDQGITPCLVGAWGYFLPWMGEAKMKAHWRNLIARYGAWPVVWCTAGEANLPWYRAEHFPYDDREQVHGWTEVLRFIRATDPFRRPLTIHPTAINQYTARHATDDPALLDFDMLQTPHGRQEAVPVTLKAVRESRAATPVMPVINGEASYEMLGDSLPTEWTRRMFWLCLMNGAAGHTYGANGIWQLNRRGQPHGPSPTAGSPPTGYGVIPWDDAMHLPGSEQVGFGASLFRQYPWWRFEPHPEWVSGIDIPPVSLDGARWIWFPEGEPSRDAPVAKRFFRRSFVLPQGNSIAQARLRVSADDWFDAQLNGHPLGTAGDWRVGRQFDPLSPWLKPGTNVLAITAANGTANVALNPAGVIAALEIRFSDGALVRVDSDATWHSAGAEVPGWEAAAFDDSAWPQAMDLGPHGMLPWGAIADPRAGSSAPQACGIPGRVRLIYAPENEPILLQGLEAGETYNVAYFDPVTGARTERGGVEAESDGSWQCLPPPGIDHDWVVVLGKAE
ncbi:MAG: DUF4038 domain-containing protein [Verrucomicrobiales bacterium]|nr:DUF4038 domain-containing protein [Verrucomicrobiales bacterium]